MECARDVEDTHLFVGLIFWLFWEATVVYLESGVV